MIIIICNYHDFIITYELNTGYWDSSWISDTNNLRSVGGIDYWLNLWVADNSADFTGGAGLGGSFDCTG